ncbi:dipeptidyl aminopeptidase [Leptospira tipperaryensis]|uniref:Dipeptidyl aminopeptidase n=1 Tax=Leptospira tipperaryensis TaxID=2564040 RepID=A0A1D7V3L1_9LEPT|nr:alpha/beta fold hydrolase [Leptospira tipperaryensis]AOP36414.1 dipeptidyl aminopeptidase [Leptospira tipperaryensis]
MKLKLIGILFGFFFLIFLFLSVGIWSASNQLLFPVWKGVTKDLSVCTEETEKYWGKGCGNLRLTQEFRFEEVKIPSINGYELPGWLIRVSENQFGRAPGVILLVHGGGSDRREETKLIRFFLNQKLDVLTFDLGCHGEAPCPISGLTYGHRESRDVLSSYLFLTDRYSKVYAMGSSVGAASILIALPSMPKLRAVIAENPMLSFEKLILDSPASPDLIPNWFIRLLIRLTMFRGEFDGLLSPLHSLRIEKTIPIYFIHSKEDNVVPYMHTKELTNVYKGPKTFWLSEKGNHGTIWDADPIEYEKRLRDFLNQKYSLSTEVFK